VQHRSAQRVGSTCRGQIVERRLSRPCSCVAVLWPLVKETVIVAGAKRDGCCTSGIHPTGYTLRSRQV